MAATPAEPLQGDTPTAMPEWLHRAVEQGVRPEQALAWIGMGLMRHLSREEAGPAWVWNGEFEEAGADLAALRQRLELTQLAIHTGAPLSTAEVAQLIGARPGGNVVERAGVTARRLGRNLWRLSHSSEEAERGRQPAFGEGFRRRL